MLILVSKLPLKCSTQLITNYTSTAGITSLYYWRLVKRLTRAKTTWWYIYICIRPNVIVGICGTHFSYILSVMRMADIIYTKYRLTWTNSGDQSYIIIKSNIIYVIVSLTIIIIIIIMIKIIIIIRIIMIIIIMIIIIIKSFIRIM